MTGLGENLGFRGDFCLSTVGQRLRGTGGTYKLLSKYQSLSTLQCTYLFHPLVFAPTLSNSQ